MKRFLGKKSTSSATQHDTPPPPAADTVPRIQPGDLLPPNMPPPPTGRPREEELEASVTVPIVMGRDTSLGLGLNSDNIVTSVRATSAGDKAGIKVGDIVLGWQGRPLAGERLQDILRPAPVHVLSIARGSALGSTARTAGAAAPTPRQTPRGVPSRHAASHQAPPVQANLALPDDLYDDEDEDDEDVARMRQAAAANARAPALGRGGQSSGADDEPDIVRYAGGWSEKGSASGAKPKGAAVDAAVGGSMDDDDGGGVVRYASRRVPPRVQHREGDDDEEEDEDETAAEHARSAAMAEARAAQGYSAVDMAEQMSSLLGGRGAGVQRPRAGPLAGVEQPGAAPLHRAVEEHGSYAARSRRPAEKRLRNHAHRHEARIARQRAARLLPSLRLDIAVCSGEERALRCRQQRRDRVADPFSDQGRCLRRENYPPSNCAVAAATALDYRQDGRVVNGLVLAAADDSRHSRRGSRSRRREGP